LVEVVAQLTSAVNELKKSAPQRKGIALAIEKRFEDGQEPAFVEDPAVVAKMQADPSINWRQLHDYRTQGTLPEGFAK
jgi:hypothetical protein